MPLTDDQRQHLEKRLREERDRIMRDLERYTRDASEQSQQEADGDLTLMPFHPADQGTDTMRQELDASLASRESSELTAIDEALRRLYKEPERYGLDEETGEEIPFERLDVIPWATRAIDGERK